MLPDSYKKVGIISASGERLGRPPLSLISEGQGDGAVHQALQVGPITIEHDRRQVLLSLRQIIPLVMDDPSKVVRPIGGLRIVMLFV